MTIVKDSKSRLLKAALAFMLALSSVGVFASASGAASPSWKLLATTGPTHLPPVQSETQRVTVEAEGGTFGLSVATGEGRVTPVSIEGTVSSTEGSPVLTIESGSFEVGARVLGAGLPFGESFVVSCSSDCEEPGSTVTMSANAEASTTGEFALISRREATVLEGEFTVGTELEATGEEEYFLPGTVVTAVSGSTIHLSKPPSSLCFFCENVNVALVQSTTPMAYDASEGEVQAAIDALGLGSDAITVTGGPGGDAAHPYLFAFGGKFENQNVQRIAVDESNLVGEHHFTSVFTTVPGGPGTGEIAIDPANIGGEATSGQYTVELGPLPENVTTGGPAGGTGWICREGPGTLS